MTTIADANWDARTTSSDGSESTCTISGVAHKTRFLEPGSITQTGLFGTVKQYKEGTSFTVASSARPSSSPPLAARPT